MAEWYEREEFWEEFEPILFDAARWEKAAEETENLLRLANVPSGAGILDLCCGPGRHCLELARRGFRVTGVDRTARYIDAARCKAAEENLAIELVVSDMRAFVRAGAFDAALNLFTSFGFFADEADDLAVARNLHASLVPGGVLVMELLGREVMARSFRERDWYWVDESRGILMLEERRLRDDWGRIDTTWKLYRDGEWRTHAFSLRLYSGTALRGLLHRAGFASVTIHGGLDGSPYDQGARRLVAVARKGEREGNG